MEKLKQIFSVKSLHGVMNHLCICNDSTCKGFNSVLSMDDLNAKTRHLIEKLSIKMEMVMRIRMLIPHQKQPLFSKLAK